MREVRTKLASTESPPTKWAWSEFFGTSHLCFHGDIVSQSRRELQQFYSFARPFGGEEIASYELCDVFRSEAEDRSAAAEADYRN